MGENSETIQPVLCVGLVCLDQVTVVDKFPLEDTDQRSIDQYKVTLFMMVKIVTPYLPRYVVEMLTTAAQSWHSWVSRLHSWVHWPMDWRGTGWWRA